MKLFISYRRDDAKHLAGRVADRLLEDEAIDEVFLDVATLELGRDFTTAIDDALGQCEVFVVLIGDDWLGAREDGTRRIDEEGDFVHHEVARALMRDDLRVIPVLAGGAAMPSELPDDLASLPKLHAASIRHESFERDVDHLADAIAGRRAARPSTGSLRQRGLGVASAAGILLAVAILHEVLLEQSLKVTLGSIALVWTVILAALTAGAWFGPRVFRR